MCNVDALYALCMCNGCGCLTGGRGANLFGPQIVSVRVRALFSYSAKFDDDIS